MIESPGAKAAGCLLKAGGTVTDHFKVDDVHDAFPNCRAFDL